MSQIKLKVIDADSEKGRNVSFKQVDIDFFNSEAGIAKIHEQFERCAHPFNFTVLMPTHTATYGKASEDRAMIKAKYGHEVLDPNMVNVIYTNNVTNPRDHRPMNAWILAHRLGHVIQVNGSILGTNPWKGICDIMEDLTGENMFTEYLHRLPGANDDIMALMPLLMTMRSARNVCMINELDVQAELIAQYLITGAVKFLPVEQWEERRAAVMAADPTLCFVGYTHRWHTDEPYLTQVGTKAFSKLDTMRSRFSDVEINEMLKAMATGVNDALRETFEANMGKVLAF